MTLSLEDRVPRVRPRIMLIQLTKGWYSLLYRVARTTHDANSDEKRRRGWHPPQTESSRSDLNFAGEDNPRYEFFRERTTRVFSNEPPAKEVPQLCSALHAKYRVLIRSESSLPDVIGYTKF